MIDEFGFDRFVSRDDEAQDQINQMKRALGIGTIEDHNLEDDDIDALYDHWQEMEVKGKQPVPFRPKEKADQVR